MILTWDKKDDASFRTILNLEYLNHYVRCEIQIFWNWISQWCSFIKQNESMVREPERCFLWQYQWLLDIESLLILYSYRHVKSVFRWEYFQKLLKPGHACLKEEVHNFLFITFLPTDSKLEGLKTVNANMGLLSQLDFAIHSVRSILKLTRKIISCFCHYIR